MLNGMSRDIPKSISGKVHTHRSGLYLTHWGVFLFVIVSWMVWETRDWMAQTPLRAMRKLEPYRGLLIASIVMLFVWIIVLIFMEVSIAWLVLTSGDLGGALAPETWVVPIPGESCCCW